MERDATGGEPHDGEQAELLAYLRALGLTTEEVERAADEGRLITAAFEQAIHPRPVLTMTALAELAGVDPAVAASVLAAMGLPAGPPDLVAYTEADVELVRVCAEAFAVLPEALLLSVLRVVGSSFDRIADASVARYYAIAQRGIDESDISLRDQAASIRAAAEALCAGIGAIAPRLLAHHLWQTSLRYWSARQHVTSYESARLAVGFVDLVGFTPLARQLTTAELGDLVSRFEQTAYDAVARGDGRLVKLIGDEVMFVALEATTACEIALSLVDAFRDDGSAITPRGGIAHGELLARDGDYYGPTVNLASRIAATAQAEEVLVTNPVRDELERAGSTLAVERAGTPVLKGFDDPIEVFRIART